MAGKIVQEESLTTVADAIRAKGGTTDALSFPTGFVDAISAIQVGGGGDESVLDALLTGNLTELTSNVSSLGDNALHSSELTAVSFPKATKIGSKALYSCKKLVTVHFPNVTSIGDNAFNMCDALQTANFPNVTKIGESAFNSCSGMTEINFPCATSVESSAFNNCGKLSAVCFPVLKTVPGSMVSSCSALLTIDLPVATSINTYVFSYCNILTAVILRSETMCKVSNKNAFNNARHMLGITHATYNPDGLQDGYVYVPSALIESYRADSVWSTCGVLFRALEDYTVDGTITGELDESKI